MGVYIARDTGRASVREPAFVPLQQYQVRLQSQSQHHHQGQLQHQAQMHRVSSGMEAGPSQQSPNAHNATQILSPSFTRRRQPPVPQLHSNTTGSKAAELERVPTEPISSPPRPRPPPTQPTPKMLLEQYGIKVRDFAYESTLPPVPTVPRPPPPRDLARRREYGNWAGGSPPVPMSEEMRRKRYQLLMPRTKQDLRAAKELERYPTEPILVNDSMNRQDSTTADNVLPNIVLAGARGLLPKTRPVIATGNAQYAFKQEQSSQSRDHLGSQSQDQYLPSSQPPLVGYSQADSDMDGLETPLITPDASQMFLNTDGVLDSSALPESQVAQMLSDSQQPAADDVSASQMGVESQSTNSQRESQAMEGVEPTAVPKISPVPSSSPSHHSPTPLSVSVRRVPSSITSRRSVSSPVASPLISRHTSGLCSGMPTRKRSYSQTSLSSLSSLSRYSTFSHEDLHSTPGSPLTIVRRNGPSRENDPLPRHGQDYASPTLESFDDVVGAGGRYNLRKIRKTTATDMTASSLPTPSRLTPQKTFGVGKRVVSRSSAHAAKKGSVKVSPTSQARSRSRVRAQTKGDGLEITPISPIKSSVRRSTRERR